MLTDSFSEKFFNSHELKRFAFPGKILWGVDSRRQLLALVPRDVRIDFIFDEIFAEDPFVKLFLASFGGSIRISHATSGAPSPQAVSELVREFPVAADFIVVVGGGSTLDFAKGLIASWLYGDVCGIGIGDRRGLSVRQGARRPVFIALPTTAGSGAESSRYYVLYDRVTREKVHGKSWQLIADWILLDPYFLRGAPNRLILHGALDAFVHFLESSFCQHERSWFGDMLSLSGMSRIFSALHAVQRTETASDAALELLYSATLAGMAISNIRTGHVHEAAGALLERTTLTHGETLLVFLRSACEFYAPILDKRYEPLWNSLSNILPGGDAPTGLVSLALWWERRFAAEGVIAPITRAVTDAGKDPALIQVIAQRVTSDLVWISKESPIHLDRSSVDVFITSSLARFTQYDR